MTTEDRAHQRAYEQRILDEERRQLLATGYRPGQPVTLPLNAMRCEVCGHRLDDMDGCDSCAADREAALEDEMDEGREGQPEFNGAFDRW